VTVQETSESRRDNYEMRVEDWGFSSDQDFTPPGFRVMPEKDGIKARLRPIVHPIIIRLHQPLLRIRYGELGLGVRHQIVWGNRGGGTQFLTRRIRRYLSPRGRRLLLLGVGFGPELHYWTRTAPSYIAGTEILNYSRAWEVIKDHYRGLRLEFFRTSGSDLSCFENKSFDIVSSTAVLEHVQDMPRHLREVSRVLISSGVAAFCFGPLYYTFGGDHFSGKEKFGEGFNHVRLGKDEYVAYLDNVAVRERGMADGRVWIRQGLFSYFKPAEYVNAFLEHFEILLLRVHLSQKALRFRSRFPGLYDQMVAERGLLPTDPLVGAMEVFLRKKAPSGSEEAE